MKKEPTEFVIVSILRWESIFKVQKSAQTPASSDWGKLIRRWGKMYLTGPHPPSATVPVSQRARVIFWMMDSATSPFGSAQNDRVGSMLVGVKILGLWNPYGNKLALCALVLG